MTVTIRIADGELRGNATNGVASFKGIPYAAPPVGDLRWCAPQPVTPWSGVREAVEFGADCIQAPGSENIQTTASEDCLFVNVWKPADAGAGDGLPVMVWIHGGGYVGGGTSIPTYDGSAFARQGIIVASFNYRLARFGFFAHPALIAAAEGLVGNYGYMDQIKALEWVCDNIAAFGGDPGRVTLIGESAGGASVIHLITSPAVKGLFSQAMVLSGAGREALLSRPMSDGSLGNLSAPTIDRMYAISKGILGDGPKDLAALRALDAAVLVGDENLEKLGKIKLLGGSIPGVPVVDGHIVVGEPEEHFLSGDAKRMPIIIGSTALDVPLHFPPSKVDPLDWFGEDEAAARKAYNVPDKRFLGPEALVKLLLSIGADMTMHEPAHFIASSMKTAGQPAWVYRFTYTAESEREEKPVQAHAGELPFLFDTLESKYGKEVTEKDRAAAKAFNTYTANFVKTGDPNGASLPEWPQVVPAEYNLMNFTLDDGPVFGPEPRPGVELVARARARHQEK